MRTPEGYPNLITTLLPEHVGLVARLFPKGSPWNYWGTVTELDGEVVIVSTGWHCYGLRDDEPSLFRDLSAYSVYVQARTILDDIHPDNDGLPVGVLHVTDGHVYGPLYGHIRAGYDTGTGARTAAVTFTPGQGDGAKAVVINSSTRTIIFTKG